MICSEADDDECKSVSDASWITWLALILLSLASFWVQAVTTEERWVNPRMQMVLRLATGTNMIHSAMPLHAQRKKSLSSTAVLLASICSVMFECGHSMLHSHGTARVENSVD